MWAGATPLSNARRGPGRRPHWRVQVSPQLIGCCLARLLSSSVSSSRPVPGLWGGRDHYCCHWRCAWCAAKSCASRTQGCQGARLSHQLAATSTQLALRTSGLPAMPRVAIVCYGRKFEYKLDGKHVWPSHIINKWWRSCCPCLHRYKIDLASMLPDPAKRQAAQRQLNSHGLTTRGQRECKTQRCCS